MPENQNSNNPNTITTPLNNNSSNNSERLPGVRDSQIIRSTPNMIKENSEKSSSSSHKASEALNRR